MADEDDDLRAALHRERVAGGSPFDARVAFDAVRPRLARARRRHTAARSAAAGLVVLAGFGVTLAVRDTTDDGIHMSDRTTEPAPSDSSSPGPSVTGQVATSTADSTTAPDPSAPARSPRSDALDAAPTTTRPGAGAIPTTTVRAGGTDDEDDGDGQGDDDVTSTTVPGADDGPGASPTSTVAPPSATTTTTTPAATSTSTSTTSSTTSSTTVPPAGPEQFTCRCGSALVDRSTGVVVVLEVDPAPGYTYRLEDREDDGAQTIQFTGAGEDCELKIPAAGPPARADDD